MVLSSNYSPYNPRLPSFPKGFISQNPQQHQPSVAGRTQEKKKSHWKKLLFFNPQHFYRSGAHFPRLHPNTQHSSKIPYSHQQRTKKLVYDKQCNKKRNEIHQIHFLRFASTDILYLLGSWNINTLMKLQHMLEKNLQTREKLTVLKKKSWKQYSVLH